MQQAQLLGFCAELAKLVETRRATGTSGKVFEGLDALSTLNNLTTLRQLLLDLKPTRSMEIGLSFGGSALVFTASHHDLGHLPARQHLAIDPFQSSVWDDSGLRIVEQAGLKEFLDFRPTSSSLELPKLLSEGVRFNLIYVDGSHLIEDVFVDAYFATRLLAEDGIVAFDDSTHPHVNKVLQFLRTNCRVGLEEIDLGRYRIDRGKTFRYRVARMLGKIQMTAFRRIGPVEREWNASYRSF